MISFAEIRRKECALRTLREIHLRPSASQYPAPPVDPRPVNENEMLGFVIARDPPRHKNEADCHRPKQGKVKSALSRRVPPPVSKINLKPLTDPPDL